MLHLVGFLQPRITKQETTNTEQVLHVKTNIHFFIYLAYFSLEWEMFQADVVENIKTRIIYSTIFFSSKIVPFMR